MDLGKTGREIKLGVAGLGHRGIEQLKLLLSMQDVKVLALCDLYEDRLMAAKAKTEELRGNSPFVTANYEEMLQVEGLEAVVIMTSWQTHLRLAVQAMKKGLVPAMEVGGAASVSECWNLVRTSEETGIPCMLLENCCYGREEMALLRMVREGLFGEIVHVQGGYEHDLRDEIGRGDEIRHYRLGNFMNRNGELYPTHELGPIFKYLNINRGNRMLSLVSMASKARGQSAWLKENRPESPLSQAVFQQGDVVNTLIKCQNGETILLTHDCTLPRPYSRGGRVQGTKGIWMEDNRSIYIDGRSPANPDHWTHEWEKDEAYMKEFAHPLWEAYDAFGQRGGHGGMDFLVLRAFVEALQEGKPFPLDVYDTASLMVVTALSEQSIAMGSQPVPVPDFTDGLYLDARPKCEGIYALDA